MIDVMTRIVMILIGVRADNRSTTGNANASAAPGSPILSWSRRCSGPRGWNWLKRLESWNFKYILLYLLYSPMVNSPIVVFSNKRLPCRYWVTKFRMRMVLVQMQIFDRKKKGCWCWCVVPADSWKLILVYDSDLYWKISKQFLLWIRLLSLWFTTNRDDRGFDNDIRPT